MRATKTIAVALVCLAVPLALSGCGGRRIVPTQATVDLRTVSPASDIITFGGLAAITLRKFNAFPARFSFIPVANDCEGLTSPARREIGCTVRIQRLETGGGWISLKDEAENVVATINILT